MMNPDLKLTKMVTADEEGTGFVMPRNVAEKPREVERRKFYVLSADTEAHGCLGSCPRYALITSRGESTKSCRNKFREKERVGTTVERILAGDAGEKHARTESLRESERVREMRRARIE